MTDPRHPDSDRPLAYIDVLDAVRAASIDGRMGNYGGREIHVGKLTISLNALLGLRLPAEPEAPARALQMPVRLIRSEWPPNPDLVPGGSPRFDAVYDSLSRGEPIHTPITVKWEDFTVIDGMHRLTAARLLGLATIPVRVWTGHEWVPVVTDPSQPVPTPEPPAEPINTVWGIPAEPEAPDPCDGCGASRLSMRHYIGCPMVATHHWDPVVGTWVASYPRRDILDRLMELWQEPWSEPAFGEAQMLLARLRASQTHASDCPNPHRPECGVNNPEPGADFVMCTCDAIPPHHWDPEVRQWVASQPVPTPEPPAEPRLIMCPCCGTHDIEVPASVPVAVTPDLRAALETLLIQHHGPRHVGRYEDCSDYGCSTAAAALAGATSPPAPVCPFECDYCSAAHGTDTTE